MSRIEAEARELLMRRRNTLRRGAASAAPGDPSARWTDYEAAPHPLADSARHELDEIEAALVRIVEGSYGTCQHCGGPMGLQRLRAFPEARFCLACSGAARQALE
jgi:DnaK suppressor protein